MVDTGSIADAVTAIATLLLAGAAVGATIAAFSGLKTWKHQAKWTSSFELSKTLLVGSMKRRDAVKHIRNPLGWHEEEDLQGEDVPNDELKWRGLQKKYRDRYEKLIEVRQELYAPMLEASALWKEDFPCLEQKLTNLEHDLLIEIQDYIEMHDPRHSGRDYFQSKEELNENHRVVYGSGGEKDVFGKKYEAARKEMEEFLSDKLDE